MKTHSIVPMIETGIEMFAPYDRSMMGAQLCHRKFSSIRNLWQILTCECAFCDKHANFRFQSALRGAWPLRTALWLAYWASM